MPFQAAFALDLKVCLALYFSAQLLIYLLKPFPVSNFHSTSFKSNFKLCFSAQRLICLLKPFPKPGVHFIHSMHFTIISKTMPPSPQILSTSFITLSLIFTLDPLSLLAAYVVAVILCHQIYSHPTSTSSQRTHALTRQP